VPPTRFRARWESLPASEQLAARLDRLAREAQARERLPSVAAAVARDGEVVWSRAVGLADVAAGRAATADTRYRVGSITKTFTAAAVMQLRDAGLLGLDDRIGDHVPDLPHGKPTLRRLLSHLSGIQREPPGEIWESLEPPDRDGFLASLAEVETVLPQGLAWHYSNLGFALLGEVVERVSGVPYRRYVEERLLGPVGLERTGWDADGESAVGYLAAAYDDAVSVEPSVDLRGSSASGQLWSTVGDLCRWGSFLASPDRAVLRPETAEEMRSVQVMAEPERWTLGWGLGLALHRRGNRIFAGHDGAMPGHLAAFSFRPQDRLAVSVLTNSGAAADPQALALVLAEAALALEPPPPVEWRPDEAAPDDVAPLLGRWWSEGEEFVFRWRAGRLEARLARSPDWKPPAVFERESDDRWRTVSGRERGELLRVVRDDEDRVAKLYWATYPFTRDQRPFGD
jgi:CubicO group peptidase (beta-lactamase class C family)